MKKKAQTALEYILLTVCIAVAVTAIIQKFNPKALQSYTFGGAVFPDSNGILTIHNMHN